MKINGPVFKSDVAGSVPYDDTIQTPLSGTSDVQEMLDYLKNLVAISASPGFTWGRSGNVSPSGWLLNDTVPSNISGRTIFLSSATITKVYVANQDAQAGVVFSVYEHTGDNTGMVLLGSVTTIAARSNVFTVAWVLTPGKQLAIQVDATSVNAKNPVVGVLIKGSI